MTLRRPLLSLLLAHKLDSSRAKDPAGANDRAINETGEAGVDLGSRNFNWGVPLLHLPGRAGLDLNLALSYNSLVWTKDVRT